MYICIFASYPILCLSGVSINVAAVLDEIALTTFKLRKKDIKINLEILQHRMRCRGK